jgi:hypothetical protein
MRLSLRREAAPALLPGSAGICPTRDGARGSGWCADRMLS